MKKYTFEITMHEGRDEFWEEVTRDGNSGCDGVREELVRALEGRGYSLEEDFDIRLLSFSEEPRK